MNFIVRTLSLCVFFWLTSCSEEPANRHANGYVEAVQFYISAPQAGWINQLNVTEGQPISEGDVVATLDDESQRLAVSQAQAQVAVAQQQALDLGQGARSEEIASTEYLLKSQQATLEESRLALARQKELLAKNLTAKSDFDEADARYSVAKAQVEQTRQQLKLLKLPAREHQLEAARSTEKSAEQALAQQQWQLKQRTITARNSGIVDTLFYRQGEYVSPGTPLLSVIKPDSTKVRFYVSQANLSEISPGQAVKIINDNNDQRQAAITYIGREPEFAPPVLYSNQSRAELVYLVEATLTPASGLRPGQPVDVYL
ncbi:HlyD family secretion protein [Teredinibacter turnerae]|uniref:HlyD family secretion protein n=1 Tax=Teredinibacter turnerae TaxID=2426 RepID=UPI0030D3E12A